MRKISSFALLVAGLLISANTWAVTQVATEAELNTALGNGGEILLTEDLVLNTYGGWTITNKTVVLDLGGHSITGSIACGNKAPNCRMFKATGTTDLTVKNGTLITMGEKYPNAKAGDDSGAGQGYYGAFRAEGGAPTVRLDGLTLRNYRPWGMNIKICNVNQAQATGYIKNCKIYSEWGGGVEIAGGIAVIENCSFSQTGKFDHASSCISVSSDDEVSPAVVGELTVRNSTYDVTGNYALYVFNSGGKLNVESGQFSSTSAEGVVLEIDRTATTPAEATVEITGGVYSGKIRFSGENSEKTLNITDGNFTNVSTIDASGVSSNHVNISGGQYGAGTVVKYKDNEGQTQTTTIENYVTTVQTTPAQWNENPDGTFTVIPNGKTKENFTEADSTSLVEMKANITLTENKKIAQLNVTNNSTLRISDNVTLNVVGQKGVIIENGSKVEVAPKGILLVNGKVVNMATGEAAYNALVVESDADGTGCLLISPNVEMLGVDHPAATVQLYTKAKEVSSVNYWQHFALPTNGQPASFQSFSGYSSSNTTWINKWANNGWEDITSLSDLSDAFRGYNITNNTTGGAVYQFKGNIIGNGDGDLKFLNSGYNMMGNSYTAPVNMYQMLKKVRESLGSDNVELTVWVYNSQTKTHVNITEAQVDPESIFYDEDKMSTIAPMQGFIMNLKSGSSAQTEIDYVAAVWNNTKKTGVPVMAPARKSAANVAKVNIVVSNGDAAQVVSLYESANCSAEFENGIDASKYMEKNMFNIYASTENGKQSIVATDNLEGTVLSIAAGAENVYTMSFNNVNNFDYAILDTETNNVISIVEGAEYNFVATANTTADRFQIVDARTMPTAVENVKAAAAQKGIFTVLGQYVGKTEIFNTLPAGVYVVDGQRIMK